jgi:transposase-like protein
MIEAVEQPRAVRPYQDYSVERKAEVLALVQANAGNVLQTARETGIPHQTIRLWLETPERFSSLQNKTHAELDTKLNRTVHKLIDSIEEHDLETATLAAKSTAFGVVFDKLQLLRGQPTAIQANVDRQELVVILQGALSAGLSAIDVTPESAEE